MSGGLGVLRLVPAAPMMLARRWVWCLLLCPWGWGQCSVMVEVRGEDGAVVSDRSGYAVIVRESDGEVMGSTSVSQGRSSGPVGLPPGDYRVSLGLFGRDGAEESFSVGDDATERVVAFRDPAPGVLVTGRIVGAGDTAPSQRQWTLVLRREGRDVPRWLSEMEVDVWCGDDGRFVYGLPAPRPAPLDEDDAGRTFTQVSLRPAGQSEPEVQPGVLRGWREIWPGDTVDLGTVAATRWDQLPTSLVTLRERDGGVRLGASLHVEFRPENPGRWWRWSEERLLEPEVELVGLSTALAQGAGAFKIRWAGRVWSVPSGEIEDPWEWVPPPQVTLTGKLELPVAAMAKGLRVDLRHLDSTWLGESAVDTETQTYRIEEVPPGAVYLEFVHPFVGVVGAREITIPVGQTTQDVDLVGLEGWKCLHISIPEVGTSLFAASTRVWSVGFTARDESRAEFWTPFYDELGPGVYRVAVAEDFEPALWNLRLRVGGPALSFPLDGVVLKPPALVQFDLAVVEEVTQHPEVLVEVVVALPTWSLTECSRDSLAAFREARQVYPGDWDVTLILTHREHGGTQIVPLGRISEVAREASLSFEPDAKTVDRVRNAMTALLTP